MTAAIRTTQVLFGNNANSTAETRVGDVVQFEPRNQTNTSVVTLLGEKTMEGLQKLGEVWSTAQRDFLKRLNGVPATGDDKDGEKVDDVPVTPGDGDEATKETEPVQTGEPETEKEARDDAGKEGPATGTEDTEQTKEDGQEEARATTGAEVREGTEGKGPAETKEETKAEQPTAKEEGPKEKLALSVNTTEEALSPVFDWVFNNTGKGTKSLHGFLSELFTDEDTVQQAQRVLISLTCAVLCILVFVSVTTML